MKQNEQEKLKPEISCYTGVVLAAHQYFPVFMIGQQIFMLCYVCFFFLYYCFVIHLKFEFEWFQSHIGRGLYVGFIVVDLRMD